MYFLNIHIGIRQRGHKQSNDVYFDTLHVVPLSEHDSASVKKRALEKKINLRYFDDGAVGVALDETTTSQDVDDLLWIFDCKNVEEVSVIQRFLAIDRSNKERKRFLLQLGSFAKNSTCILSFLN